ncbi:MAG: hypothetical protein WBC91_14540, partial [Phototrophicaceae bacterium]
MMDKQAKKKFLTADSELMHALEITAEDLIANDNGQLLSHQHEIIRKSDAYSRVSELILGVVFGGIGGIALLGAISTLFTVPINLSATFGIGLFGLIFFLIGLVSIRSRNKTRQAVEGDIANNRLTTIQGIAIVTASERDQK